MWADEELRDDCADLAGRGGDSVGGRAVARRETLTGDDEGGCVGPEVEEELAEHVEREQCGGAELVECKSDDAEKGRENSESHKLNWLSSDGVDGEDGDPVAWNGAGADQDQISDGVVVQLVVNVGLGCVPNLRENDRVVQPETIECDIEEEP